MFTSKIIRLSCAAALAACVAAPARGGVHVTTDTSNHDVFWSVSDDVYNNTDYQWIDDYWGGGTSRLAVALVFFYDDNSGDGIDAQIVSWLANEPPTIYNPLMTGLGVDPGIGMLLGVSYLGGNGDDAANEGGVDFVQDPSSGLWTLQLSSWQAYGDSPTMFECYYNAFYSDQGAFIMVFYHEEIGYKWGALVGEPFTAYLHISPIPEPATGLLALAGIGLLLAQKRRRT